MSKLAEDGHFTFTASTTDAPPGTPYAFYVDGQGPFPDPASRYQPKGVHGSSVIVDPASFEWHDSDWRGLALQDIIIYELHVGAFTPEGTFRSAAAKLPYLKDLGINTIELMPLSDFPGSRNWGYDGVAPFAPAHAYGSPDSLRAFVDEAHRLGLAVFVDVVYNHFGPDGAYQGTFSSHYFTKRHHTPWGDAINFDAPLNQPVREYIIENALRWIYEFHVDGLRLDATHTIKDDSPHHILTELAAAVRQASTDLGRRIHVIAEDARNLAQLARPESAGGFGLAGIWSDDFHHQMRRLLAGDTDGYFAPFDGTVSTLARSIKDGWWRQHSNLTGLDYPQFVYCIQNHDQIGNRALGDRLHHAIDAAAYRAASALLLLLPQTPLLFMGQEWAASTPFLYFADHHAELGQLVTEGRRREFAEFAAFAHTEVPDPQDPETFAVSHLRWQEIKSEPHASMLRLYKSLLRLRHIESAEGSVQSSPDLHVEALDDSTLLLKRSVFASVIRLKGQGCVHLNNKLSLDAPVWNSEDLQFAVDSLPIRMDSSDVVFARPGAIVFRNPRQESD